MGKLLINTPQNVEFEYNSLDDPCVLKGNCDFFLLHIFQ